MSIVAFKRKSAIMYGTHVSGRSPGGTWISRGPFGKPYHYSTNDNGFSINGAHRNKGAVGTPMAFSKNGTPFKGVYAMGSGGCCSSYYDRNQCMNVNKAVVVPGTQYKYVKQSVLSNYGMLRTKYKWAYNGKYPNYWVKNIYPSSALDGNKSQDLYIHNKSSNNMCVKKGVEINPEELYIQGLTKNCYVKHLPEPNQSNHTCVSQIS